MFTFLKKPAVISEPEELQPNVESVDKCFLNFVDLMEKMSLLFRKNIASSSDVIPMCFASRKNSSFFPAAWKKLFLQ